MKLRVVAACGILILLAVAAAQAQSNRQGYARNLEELFLKHGFDAYVSADGPKHDTLHVKYTLMSRPLVYRFMTEDMFKPAGKLGFRKLILESDSAAWQFHWDGQNWQTGKPPAEIAADKAREARERERRRKVEEAVAAQEEARDEAIRNAPCPEGMVRQVTTYGSYCAAKK